MWPWRWTLTEHGQLTGGRDVLVGVVRHAAVGAGIIVAHAADQQVTAAQQGVLLRSVGAKQQDVDQTRDVCVHTHTHKQCRYSLTASGVMLRKKK